MIGTTNKIIDTNKAPISEYRLKEYWAYCVCNAISGLANAFYEATHARGLSQDIISERLQKDKSQISKILRGHTKNLTIKTLSEMSLAMDCELQINFIKKEDIPPANYVYNLNEMYIPQARINSTCGSFKPLPASF